MERESKQAGEGAYCVSAADRRRMLELVALAQTFTDLRSDTGYSLTQQEAAECLSALERMIDDMSERRE